MHYDKMKNGGESAVLMHNARALEHHANENIDPGKSHLNTNLTSMLNPDDARTDWQRFKDRLNELSYRKQKNNVRMCSIIITAPKNIKPEDVDKFFLVAHKELNALTGGTENEVSAWIHKDETTPHMHYAFVPGVIINGVPKLSASKLVDRQFLKKLHPRMQQAINNAFEHDKYKVVADNPADRAKDSTPMGTYKAIMSKVDVAEEQLSAITHDVSNMTFEKLQQDIQYSEGENRLNALNSDIKQMQGTLDRLEQLKRQESANIELLRQEKQQLLTDMDGMRQEQTQARANLHKILQDSHKLTAVMEQAENRLSWDNIKQQVYESAPKHYRSAMDLIFKRNYAYWQKNFEPLQNEIHDSRIAVEEIQNEYQIQEFDDLEL